MSLIQSSSQRGDGFPIMHGADTVIVLSDRRHFRVHSVILKQTSVLFAKLLEKDGLAQDAAVRYHVVLQNYDKHTGDEILPVFRRVDLDSRGRPIKPISVIHEYDESSVEPKHFDHFQKVLGSIFGMELTVHTSTIQAALNDAVGLISTAEYLGALPHVAKTVDNALISMGQTLYRAIADSPVPWINLATRMESKVIFRDAAAHLVGKYQLFKDQTAKGTSDVDVYPRALDMCSVEVRGLIRVKAEELQNVCQKIDTDLMTYYPANLLRESTSLRADRDDIGRSSYAADIFGWMALALFRHFVGCAVASCETWLCPDGGYSFYKEIAEGSMAYLDREQVALFHDRFPMSTKGKSVFINHLEIIKEASKDYVKSILKNETALDTNSHRIDWLVCARVEDNELPWAKTAENPQPPSAPNGQSVVNTTFDEDSEFDDQSDLDLALEDDYIDSRDPDSLQTYLNEEQANQD